MLSFCSKCGSLIVDGECSAHCGERHPVPWSKEPYCDFARDWKDPITAKRRRPPTLGGSAV